MKKVNGLVLIVLLAVSFVAKAQQNIGVGTTNPLQKLHIGGAANTIRVDGVATGGNFVVASSANTDRLLYVNANGDIMSIPVGSIGSVLMLNNSGYLTWSALNASAITGGQALTKTDDANVTLTLGGTPSTSLLSSTSLTLGWAGQLSTSRGGTGLGTLGSSNQLLGVNNAGTGLEYKTISTSGTAVSNDVGVTLSNANSIAINLPSASATVRGVLTATDWVAFNSKWSLTGNSGSAPATNFIGTTDAKNLVFRVNSANANGGWSGFIDQSGNGQTFFGYLAGKTTAANNNANASTDNTAIGANALTANTYAGQNTAVGSGAMKTQSFGTSVWLSDNTAVGYNAMRDNQPTAQNLSGFRNTAVGSQALMANATGYDNIAIGYQAMLNNNTRDNLAVGNNALQNNAGVQNTAIGHGALGGNANGCNWNTAVGYQAISGSNAGTYNVGVGQGALYSNTKASFNVGVGTDVARNNTNGQYNVSMGYQAMYTQSYTGGGAGVAYASSNTAIGYQAMYSNQPTSINNGNKNTAIGDSSMYSNTTGTYNTATGYQSLLANTVGAQNTAYGTYALSANTSANENTAFGYSALLNNITGSSNTAVGIYAMNGINPPFGGSYNAAFGTEALRRTGNGNFNAAYGARAMYSNQVGNQNTALGYGALYATLADNNTGVGYQAGYTSIPGNANTSGTYNVYVGYNAGPGTSTQYINSVAIGAYATVSQSNSMVLGSINGINGATSNTNVGIGTQTPNSSLQVNGSFATAIAAKSAAYTLTTTDAIVTGDATGAAFNITLPTAVGIDGRQYTIKKTDASSNAVTIATTSSQTIDGSTTYSLGAQWKYVTVVSNGANWIVVANN